MQHLLPEEDFHLFTFFTHIPLSSSNSCRIYRTVCCSNTHCLQCNSFYAQGQSSSLSSVYNDTKSTETLMKRYKPNNTPNTPGCQFDCDCEVAEEITCEMQVAILVFRCDKLVNIFKCTNPTRCYCNTTWLNSLEGGVPYRKDDDTSIFSLITVVG